MEVAGGGARDGSGFHGALSEEEWRDLAARGRRRRYPKGSSLFSEGERAESVVVRRGVTILDLSGLRHRAM